MVSSHERDEELEEETDLGEAEEATSEWAMSSSDLLRRGANPHYSSSDHAKYLSRLSLFPILLVEENRQFSDLIKIGVADLLFMNAKMNQELRNMQAELQAAALPIRIRRVRLKEAISVAKTLREKLLALSADDARLTSARVENILNQMGQRISTNTDPLEYSPRQSPVLLFLHNSARAIEDALESTLSDLPVGAGRPSTAMNIRMHVEILGCIWNAMTGDIPDTGTKNGSFRHFVNTFLPDIDNSYSETKAESAIFRLYRKNRFNPLFYSRIIKYEDDEYTGLRPITDATRFDMETLQEIRRELEAKRGQANARGQRDTDNTD